MTRWYQCVRRSWLRNLGTLPPLARLVFALQDGTNEWKST